MDFISNYEITRTADFIQSKNFTRVALQFPDELLKDSTRVASALRAELRSRIESDAEESSDLRDVGIFVMADTTYGSCCVDEVGASHVDADCVVHYGHTCLSPTSTLPVLFVFGKASIDVYACVESLWDCLSTSDKPVMVLFGLEYAHAVESIKESMTVKSLRSCTSNLQPHYAGIRCSVMNPLEDNKIYNGQFGSFNDPASDGDLLKCFDTSKSQESDYCRQINSSISSTSYSLGGLILNLPEGHKIKDYLLFWIGSDNPAFANVVLTFNDCEIVRYDAVENSLVKDLSHQKRILKRRYYLVEKAKDANIVGILVGTLGVAGYLHMIGQMKELIKAAGKKAYTLVMGRPNPAKLANFPECDVFIFVSCAQTALLDSKEFLAPVITPFEATLAFSRGSQWTGAYVMEFQDLMAPSLEVSNITEEARFSFIGGGYVEDFELQGKSIQADRILLQEKGEEHKERDLVLAEAAQKALKVGDTPLPIFIKGTAKSGAEYFATRTYHGLEMPREKLPARSVVIGRTGKASGYDDEKIEQENT
ncbi:diphthamide synthesis DPH2 family protein [Tasmannia lanceolata]|uniref:diphthamide synthesis DPH2 family protein n=1 Tax=Tasmannia lanceolata TaxID=3420 RepID=UPI004062DFF1